MNARKFLVLVLLVSTLCSVCYGWGNKDKVLLKDIGALTLNKGQMTTGRRSSPVPQLTLKGGSGASYGPVDTVQCINKGHDGYDVQWECVANLPKEVKFGMVNVNCEGYDYPEDPYILRGSCGLAYTLELTGAGNSGSYSHNNYQSGYKSYDRSSSGSGFSHIFLLIAVGGVIYIVYNNCLRPGRNSTAPRSSPPPYDEATRASSRPRSRLYPDIPPPTYPGNEPTAPPDEASRQTSGSQYGWNSDYTSGAGTAGAGTSAYSGSRTHTIFDTPGQSQTRTETNTNQSRPGFWSGMAAGGLMGYLFGNRGRGDNYGYYQPHYGRRSWWNSGPSYSSGWGSQNNSGWGSSGSGWSFGGGSRSSGGMGGTHRSSGFGGTSRR